MDLYLAAGPVAAPRRAARTLCFDWAALDSLERRGLPARAWEDLIPAGLGVEYTAMSRRVAAGWRRDGEEDFTMFDGVSLGEAFHWLLWHQTLHPAFKFLAALRQALTDERPASVLCDRAVPRLFRDVLSSAAGTEKFKLEWLGGEAAASNSIAWTAPELSWNRGKRWAGGLVNALARSNGRRADLLLSYYPSLEPVLARALRPGAPFHCVLTDSPGRRNIPAMVRGSAEFFLAPRTRPRLSKAQASALAAMRARWGKVKREPAYREKFTWLGLSAWTAVEPALDAFFQDQLETLAWVASRFEERWRRTPPAALLLPYDGPPFQNLLCAVAKRHGTPAAMLLHGLPFDYGFPFQHRATSHFFVWGRAQKELYERAHEGDGRRFIALGNPGFDRHPTPPRAAASRNPHKVLVLSNPQNQISLLSSGLDPERFACRVLDALTGLDLAVTFKLHPAESLAHYQEVLAGRPVRLVKDAPIGRCLAEADLVIGPFSTVLIEAMILGKPLLCVNLGREDYSPPFDGEWGVPQVRGAADLRERVQALSKEPAKELAALREPYPRILEAFAGPLDGGAAERVLSELGRLAA